MTTISKPLFFLRYIMPIIVIIFISITIFVIIQTGEYKKSILPAIFPFLMIAFFYVIFKRFVWDLADDVLDNGDVLLIRKSGNEIVIPLSNIMNVSSAMMQNPPRITLRLRVPCMLGDEVSFCPLEPGFALLRTKSVIAEDLIQRIDKLK